MIDPTAQTFSRGMSILNFPDLEDGISQHGLGVEGFARSIMQKFNNELTTSILERLDNAAAQTQGIPAENLQNVVFDLDLREVLGNDNVLMLHNAGLPESLMLDIYMSWRTMTKRAPETDADFVQYNAFVHDQLEMIYDGMSEEVTQQARVNCGAAPQGDADDGQSRFLDLLVPNVVNLSWVAGSRAEQEIAPVLATMPNHEFVIDSVRDLPGNSIGMTVTDDPRMCDVEEDPKEMGPVDNYRLATEAEVRAGTYSDRSTINAKPGLYRTGLVDTGAQQMDWSKMSRMEVGVAIAIPALQPNALDYTQYFQ